MDSKIRNNFESEIIYQATEYNGHPIIQLAFISGAEWFRDNCTPQKSPTPSLPTGEGVTACTNPAHCSTEAKSSMEHSESRDQEGADIPNLIPNKILFGLAGLAVGLIIVLILQVFSPLL